MYIKIQIFYLYPNQHDVSSIITKIVGFSKKIVYPSTGINGYLNNLVNCYLFCDPRYKATLSIKVNKYFNEKMLIFLSFSFLELNEWQAYRFLRTEGINDMKF